MAKLEIPVVIDGVKSIEELANRVLDEYEYHGRTIREWADLISKIPPHSRLIDADALLSLLDKCMFPSDMVTTSAVRMATNWIKDAPTIIPADEPTQSNAPNTLDALTNADRIRAMTDEELAEFLNGHNFCAHNFDCEKGRHPCRECNLDWLKEVTE